MTGLHLNFDEISLAPALVRAVTDLGYTQLTPIQAQAIPEALTGRDLLGIAQTGTGKTAAFALPTLHFLAQKTPRKRVIRTLVLAPTRELAAQIGDSFATYGAHLSLRQAVIFGGVGAEPQRRALRGGLDILIATPGRLLDLMGQGEVDLSHIQVFILDEADRMLDMGFVNDVRKVVAKLPTERQTLLFSATMPKEIVSLSSSILRNPARVEVAPQATTAERVEQHILFVEKADKRRLLEELLSRPAITRAIVFTRTKHGANRAAQHLTKAGIEAMAIHGNKSQGARERALHAFRDGSLRVLIATDIAARGIDVDEISHVINFDLPNVPEQYVHRIGRTARAGSSGMALSFCDLEERAYLRDIEKLTRQRIPVVQQHPFKSEHPAHILPAAPPKSRGSGGRRHSRGRR